VKADQGGEEKTRFIEKTMGELLKEGEQKYHRRKGD